MVTINLKFIPLGKTTVVISYRLKNASTETNASIYSCSSSHFYAITDLISGPSFKREVLDAFFLSGAVDFHIAVLDYQPSIF